jgi:hypothetical protein
LNTEQREEVEVGGDGRQAFRPRGTVEVLRRQIVSGEAIEGGAVRLEGRQGKHTNRARHGIGLPAIFGPDATIDLHQPVRIRKWQRSQQYAIDDAEDGGRGTGCQR